ncbi:Neurotrypsin, partial [Geodia barretti]
SLLFPPLTPRSRHPTSFKAIPVNPNPVQLIDGPSINEGRLQIYYNNEWGTVCDDRWGLDEASVVCKSLGFPGADGHKYLLHDYGPGSGHIWLDDVVCTGEEFFIQDCNHGDIGENNCAHYEDVGLRCLPNTLKVRLVNGGNVSSGRVEVQYNDEEWGTICDDRYHSMGVWKYIIWEWVYGCVGMSVCKYVIWEWVYGCVGMSVWKYVIWEWVYGCVRMSVWKYICNMGMGVRMCENECMEVCNMGMGVRMCEN